MTSTSRVAFSAPSVRRFVPAALTLALLSAIRLSAANVWDGGGADNAWSAAQNWDDDLVPTFPAALTFAGSTRLQPVNDIAGNTVNGLVFSSTAGAFTLSGEAVSLGGDIENASSSTQTLGLPLALTASRVVNTASGDLAFSGVVSGAFDVNKRGAKTLTLSGIHTYTGRTGVGSFPNGVAMTPSTHQGGGTLILDFSAPGSPVSNLIYNGLASIGATQELRLSSGAVVLKGKDGTDNAQTVGQLGIAAGFNTVTLQPGVGGKVVLNAGAITLAGGASADNNKSSLVNFILPSGTQDATNGITTNSINHASGILTPITGNIANLVVNGTSWATNATNAAGGNILPFPDSSYVLSTATTTGSSTQNVDMVTDTSVANPSPWTLRFNNTGTTGPRVLTNTNATAAMTIAGGGILVTSGMGADDVTITGGLLRGSSNRGLFISNYNTGGGRLVINSNIVNNSNSNTLTVGGGGTVRLNGTNTYTNGTYVLKDTTLVISSDANLGFGSGAVSVASASTSSPAVTLAATGSGNGSWVVGASVLGSTVTAITGTAVTLAGNANADISTATSVSYASATALSLDGGTLVADGTFDMRRTQPVDASGVGGDAVSDRRIGLSGNGGTIEVTSGNTFTVHGVVSSQTTRGFGALRKTGAGTLALAGVNTYAGGTTVLAGALRAGSSSAFGSTSALLSLAAGTTLQVAGQTVTTANLSADPASFIENSAATNGTLVVNTAQNLTLGATLQNGSAGLLQLTKQNANTLTLTGANTHGGDTLLSSGTVVLANALALQDSSVNQQGGALIFDASVASGAFTLGGLKNNSSAHVVVLENNASVPAPVALTVGGNNRSNTYSGTLSGAGSLTKIGTGSFTLSGPNTYVGGTAINAGSVILSGVGALGSGPVSLAAGATLDVSALDAATPSITAAFSGAGNIQTGDKTLALAGAVSLAGNVAVTGNLALGGGAARVLRVAGSAARDQIAVTGNLSLDGDLAIVTAEGASLAAGQTHAFYSAASVTTGFDSVTIDGVALTGSSGVWTGTGSGLTYTFTEATGELAVTSGSTLSALETWRQTHFGTSANSGNAADSADPDADGVANLLEYATGSSPVLAGGPAAQAGLVDGRLSLTYQRIADPALTYTVQVSTDLAGSWTTLAVAGNPSTGAANLAGSVTVSDTVAASAQARRFLRLVVTR